MLGDNCRAHDLPYGDCIECERVLNRASIAALKDLHKTVAYLKLATDRKLNKAIKLLEAAKCPECKDNSGVYVDDHGEPAQCRWCYDFEELKTNP